ncbi:MAG: NAD(P)H-quinone oxidoreductase subunit 2, chloroplastic [Phycisphaerales bacterium]|nr:NAD(P)H-quinone oxidoreductase subunit 2, chloroplastic [Phycisphaerales bacterium]
MTATELSTFTLTLASLVQESGHAAPAHSEPAAGGMATLLVPVFTLLGTVLCGLFAAFKVKSKLPAWTTVLLLAASFAAIVYTYATGQGTTSPVIAHGFDWISITWGEFGSAGHGHGIAANFSFYVDALTLLWMLFVTGLGTLIALYASEYMSHDVGAGYCRFFAAFNLFVFSMSCLVMADNFLLLYLGWEGVGLCSYLLIGYFYKKPSAVAAAKKAFIVNRIGDLGLALGVFLIYVQFGSVEYKAVFAEAGRYIDAARAGHFDQIPWQVQLIPLLLMVGAFGKSAQLPLYVWLPDAMEGPTPVSALIHAATMVTAGVYLVARSYPLFLCSETALPVVAWVGTLTALLAATIGMAQFDIKRIMAYSTVSQLGYMFAGLGVLTSTGAAFHVLTHAFFKALLFLCCGAVMHGFAGQLDLRKLSGVWKIPGWKVVSVGMLIGCANLSGFPLTPGFFSKDMILAEAFVTPGMAAIGWLLLLTAGLTAYYTFRVFFRVFVGPVEYEPGDELHAHDDHGHDGHAEAHGTVHGHGDSHGHSAATGNHGHAGHFHPHAPGWAINTVLAILATLSIVAAGLYFMGDHGGWAANMVHHSTAALPPAPADHAAESGAGHAHGSFLGMDPHAVMYYVSAVVGFIGIGVAFWLHFAGRTTAATSRADALVPKLGAVARAAQHKWYVDEIYDFLLVKPLWVLSHIFHLIDALLVDGLVDFAGWVPRTVGKVIRPAQSGLLHGYAIGMAGGLAVLLLIVLLAVT